MIKVIHIATVSLSLCLFVARGVWIYLLKNQLTSRWLKVLPHINDTFLLITGISLAIQLQQYPFVHHWLTVKLCCLLVYIGLGLSAMKWHKNTKQGFISWVLAIMIFIYMVSVALNHHPLGLFAGL